MLMPERTFDPARPLYVRRFFVAAGRHFNIGDEFDWRRLSVDMRRTKLLHDAGKLTHDCPAKAAQASAAPAPMTPTPSIAQEIEDEDILATAAPLPERAEPAPAEPETEDDLDGLDLKELRAIALKEGVAFRVSREAQRTAIREHRRGQD